MNNLCYYGKNYYKLFKMIELWFKVHGDTLKFMKI
jgi:hypothetical protein